MKNSKKTYSLGAIAMAGHLANALPCRSGRRLLQNRRTKLFKRQMAFSIDFSHLLRPALCSEIGLCAETATAKLNQFPELNSLATVLKVRDGRLFRHPTSVDGHAKHDRKGLALKITNATIQKSNDLVEKSTIY